MSTVATALLSELQVPVPPPRITPLAVYVVVAPMHNGELPVTDDIAALETTVTVAVVAPVLTQPVIGLVTMAV